MFKKVLILSALFLSLFGVNHAGAEGLTVAPTVAQVINGSKLVDAAAAVIRQRIGITADSGDVTITPVDAPQDIMVPDGDAVVTAQLPYGVRYSGLTAAIVTVKVNGSVYTVLGLKFNITMLKNVVVATRMIAAGEQITTGDIRYERMDIGRLPAGYITDNSKALGLVARRPLTPGTVFNSSFLAKPVVIKRSGAVTIVARIGGIQVNALGQALQNGCEGQVIRVENLNSRKIIAARVLDESTVVVTTYNGK